MMLMTECELVARKWGNSLGATFPKEIVEKEHLHENDKIQVIIIRRSTPTNLFGRFKGRWNKSAQQIKDELREELYDD